MFSGKKFIVGSELSDVSQKKHTYIWQMKEHNFSENSMVQHLKQKDLPFVILKL